MRDYRFYLPKMAEYKNNPGKWLAGVTLKDLERVKQEIKKHGPLGITEFKSEKLRQKTHDWDSRKPAKRALEFGFFRGDLVISNRLGMLKNYELVERHFESLDRHTLPEEQEIWTYRLDRSMRAHGFVDLDSICYLRPGLKKSALSYILEREKKKSWIQIQLKGKNYWSTPENIERGLQLKTDSDLTNILSPFDPLVIQRKRLREVFDYDHRFEAYLPSPQRKFGYFTLPVLVGDEFVAGVDLKFDRSLKELKIQNWHWWVSKDRRRYRELIEQEIERFEKFHIGTSKGNLNE